VTETDTILSRLYECISKDAKPDEAAVAAYALEVLGNFLGDINRIAAASERIATSLENISANTDEEIGNKRVDRG
jgi:hypothetical protein